MIVYDLKFIGHFKHGCCCKDNIPQQGKNARPSVYWHTERGCEAWCNGISSNGTTHHIKLFSDLNEAYRYLQTCSHPDGTYIIDFLYEE